MLRPRVEQLVMAAAIAGHPLAIEISERFNKSPLDTRDLPSDVISKGGMLFLKHVRYENELDSLLIRRVRTWGEQVVSKSTPTKGSSVVGLCGSLAYGTMKWGDDLDLFLISKKGQLWPTLIRMFVALRAISLKLRIYKIPFKFCLSYAVDEYEFRNVGNDSSFMRRIEISTAIPVIGRNQYTTLLVQGRSQFAQRSRFGNSLAMMFLKPYLALKRHLYNARFRRSRQYTRLFWHITSPTSFIVSSRRYRILEKFYEAMVDEA